MGGKPATPQRGRRQPQPLVVYGHSGIACCTFPARFFTAPRASPAGGAEAPRGRRKPPLAPPVTHFAANLQVFCRYKSGNGCPVYLCLLPSWMRGAYGGGQVPIAIAKWNHMSATVLHCTAGGLVYAG